MWDVANGLRDFVGLSLWPSLKTKIGLLEVACIINYVYGTFDIGGLFYDSSGASH